MKRVVRVLSAAAASALAFGLVACGSNASSGKELTIGFVPGIASDPFFLAMRLGAEAEAKKLGVRLLWQGAANEYSPQSEIPFVDAMLAQHVDGLALVPTDPDALQPSVSKAQALHIPVATVDTTATDKTYQRLQ